jgi:hypothetical protein
MTCHIFLLIIKKRNIIKIIKLPLSIHEVYKKDIKTEKERTKKENRTHKTQKQEEYITATNSQNP